MSERIVWRTAEPLWSEIGAGTPAPAVLRFAGDDFMDQFVDAVACGGDGLAAMVARDETWRDPAAGLHPRDTAAERTAVKLYQPTHERFYLVVGSLVCRRYGHPDRAVDAGADESVGYVLRRLEPKDEQHLDITASDTYDEYGWSTAVPNGAWVPATTGRLAPEEDVLPVFPVGARCGGRQRRLHAALLPVSKREAFETNPVRPAPDEVDGDDDPMAPLADPRLAELEPLLVALLQFWDGTGLPEGSVVLEGLFYTMVDLADWLDEHLDQELTSSTSAIGLDRVFGRIDHEDGQPWRTALLRARQSEPTASFQEGSPLPAPVRPASGGGMSLENLRGAVDDLLFDRGSARPVPDEPYPSQTHFFEDVAAALEARDAAETAASEAAAGTQPSVPASATTTPEGVYVARFVYQRPHCRPAERLVLSEPTRPFRFAAFHDPDAPGRPVRIALPVDTSPGALRRFPKNVSIVLSSQLRRQMQRVNEETLRDGSLGSGGGVSFGMLCTLSIPIITICALILLMIIVSILNIVFWWLPLFKICIPLPRRGGS
jgi:hypothetical protein